MKRNIFFPFLFLFGTCSAQLPKIKYLYKSKFSFDANKGAMDSVLKYYCSYSTSGKMLNEKEYYEGKISTENIYIYNDKDSLISTIYKYESGDCDSFVTIYKNNSDTVKRYIYQKGKITMSWETGYFKNGKKSFSRMLSSNNTLYRESKYDSSGRVISSKGKDYLAEYDKFGNMIKLIKRKDTTYFRFSDNGKYKTEEIKISQKCMHNFRSISLFDNKGNLIKEINYSCGHILDSAGNEKAEFIDSTLTTNQYDEKNNLTKTQTFYYNEYKSDSTIYEYDKSNRLITERFYNRHGDIPRIISYAYDKYGNILEEAHYISDKYKLPDWKCVYTYEFY